jgi:hypothetical protein
MVRPRHPKRILDYVRSAIAALLVVAPLSCAEAAKTSAVPQDQHASDGDHLTYDVGTVLAGEIVTGRLTVRNDSTESISIRDDRDVKPNCGCSELRPECKEIGAGSSAPVIVKANTFAKSGNFSIGGTITWTAPSGAQRTTYVSVDGTAVPPLQIEPSSLHFSPDEIAARNLKEVKVTAAVPINWDDVLVSGSSSVRFGARRRDADRLVLEIGCSIPDSLEALNETVSLTAIVRDHRLSLNGKSVSVDIPITAFRKIEFAV